MTLEKLSPLVTSFPFDFFLEGKGLNVSWARKKAHGTDLAGWDGLLLVSAPGPTDIKIGDAAFQKCEFRFG